MPQAGVASAGGVDPERGWRLPWSRPVPPFESRPQTSALWLLEPTASLPAFVSPGTFELPFPRATPLTVCVPLCLERRRPTQVGSRQLHLRRARSPYRCDVGDRGAADKEVGPPSNGSRGRYVRGQPSVHPLKR